MGREGMVVYLIASTTSLLGRTIQAIRLPTALASTATVFVVFWLGRLLFANDDKTGEPTPWRGLLIGGVARRSDGNLPRPDLIWAVSPSELTSCHFSFHFVWLGFGLAGTAATGGKSHWQECAQDCSLTPTIRHAYGSLSFPLLRPELSSSSWPGCLDRNPLRTSKDRSLPRSGRAGCRANSALCRPASQYLLPARQPTIDLQPATHTGRRFGPLCGTT